MDASDQSRIANNIRFRDLCAEARAWLVQELIKGGHNSFIRDAHVVTAAKDAATGVSAEARIDISGVWGSSWSKMVTGIKVKVERNRHPITYTRNTEQWKNFPWDKIIAAHIAEVTCRLQNNIAARNERSTMDEMTRLAQIEVSLPIAADNYDGVYLAGFTRRRNPRGTYSVQLNCCGLTPVEACIIRDIVLAVEKRKSQTDTPKLQHETKIKNKTE